jgi:putative signal transducing protein
MASDGPLVVATFPLPTEAEMARELLEQNGIAAVLRDAGFVGVHPWLSNAVGGVKLVVPAEDARRARELLAFAGLAAVFPRLVEDDPTD